MGKIIGAAGCVCEKLVNGSCLLHSKGSRALGVRYNNLAISGSVMPFQQLQEADGSIEAQLPSHMQRIEFEKLQLSPSSNQYVEGTILAKYPTHEFGTGEKVFKMVLEESTTQQSVSNPETINTFIFGKLVNDCEHALKQGDRVVLTKFQVSTSPSARKDGRHVLQLELSEETGATVFVYAKSVKESAASSNVNSPINQRLKIGTQDYTYVPLNQIKDGVTVNVYGVVKFFKPPYRSKGTDFSSTVTIVDASNGRLNCVLFNGNADLLPKICKVGDVVRFHRIKVCDGTKCPHTLRQVPVDMNTLEGDPADIHRLCKLTVDVLIYDNHVGAAHSLKVGTYLTIHNIHAKLATLNAEKPSTSLETVPEMEFHLHGGTSYGRGITVLPEECSDVQQLKQTLEPAISEDQDSLGDLTLLETLNTSRRPSAPERATATRVERCHQESATVLTAHQHIRTTSLRDVLDQTPPQKYRIRAKLANYEPKALHESVKLYCPKCHSLQEIPSDDHVDSFLQDAYTSGSAAAGPDPPTHDAPWYQTTTWEAEDQRRRQITVHFVKSDEAQSTPERSTILVEGVSLNELYRLSKRFAMLIPITSRTKCLTLNDLSIPFLIQDRKWHYGCKHCSHPQPVNALQPLSQTGPWDLSVIAKVLGVQLLRHVFVMRFTLDDGSGSLDAFLWDKVEQFFGISAADVVIDEALQDKLTRIMDTLCPPRTSDDDCPWLECCIKSYYVSDGSEQKTHYQIFDTVVAEAEDV
ncbi:protection of telomeres protein 1 isoform X3 [Scyliorhinus torazame]|uniref:protection of telomeres protein 1 isoform X3 n=1 Tax=Scyliorhinus torazame TaxID=75743 RepID=UPI003B592A0F